MRLKNLFLIVGIVLMIGVVSAVCEIKQPPFGVNKRVIMEVSGESNAHGAVYSGTPQAGHWYVICDKSDVGEPKGYSCDLRNTDRLFYAFF